MYQFYSEKWKKWIFLQYFLSEVQSAMYQSIQPESFMYEKKQIFNLNSSENHKKGFACLQYEDW